MLSSNTAVQTAQAICLQGKKKMSLNLSVQIVQEGTYGILKAFESKRKNDTIQLSYIAEKDIQMNSSFVKIHVI